MNYLHLLLLVLTLAACGGGDPECDPSPASAISSAQPGSGPAVHIPRMPSGCETR